VRSFPPYPRVSVFSFIDRRSRRHPPRVREVDCSSTLSHLWCWTFQLHSAPAAGSRIASVAILAQAPYEFPSCHEPQVETQAMWSLDSSSESDPDSAAEPEVAEPATPVAAARSSSVNPSEPLEPQGAVGLSMERPEAGTQGPHLSAQSSLEASPLPPPEKKLRRIISNPEGKPMFFMSPSGPSIVPAYVYPPVPGCEWWMKFFCDSTATRRTVQGKQLRRMRCHSLCSGLAPEMFLAEVGSLVYSPHGNFSRWPTFNL
jgi:hypothetical protein